MNKRIEIDPMKFLASPFGQSAPHDVMGMYLRRLCNFVAYPTLSEDRIRNTLDVGDTDWDRLEAYMGIMPEFPGVEVYEVGELNIPDAQPPAPEPVEEPKEEIKKEPKKDKLPKKQKTPPSEITQFYQKFVAKWNGLPAPVHEIRRLSPQRKAKLKTRHGDDYWRDHWEDALDRAAKIPGLMGDNDRNWSIDFDWFMRPDTVLKLLEGKWANWGKDKQEQQPETTSFAEIPAQAEELNVDD